MKKLLFLFLFFPVLLHAQQTYWTTSPSGWTALSSPAFRFKANTPDSTNSLLVFNPLTGRYNEIYTSVESNKRFAKYGDTTGIGGKFIVNSTSQQGLANWNISGSGTLGGALRLKYGGTSGTPPSGYGEISLSSVGSEVITKANGQTRTFLFPYNGNTSARFPYKAASIIPDSTDVAATYVKKAGDTMTGSLFVTNSGIVTIGDSTSAYPHPSAILTKTVTTTDTSSHGWVDRRRLNSGTADAQYDDQLLILDGKDYTGKHIAGFQMNASNQATLPPTSIYSYITTFSNTGGTIPNYYGAFINNPTGSYTNKYGLFLGVFSGATTNNWQIFASGTTTTSKSYFGGSLVINDTSTPTARLVVKSLGTGAQLVAYKNTLGNNIGTFFERASSDGQFNVNSSTGAVNVLLDGGTGTPSFINAGLNVGVSSSTATAKLAVTSTTEQLRLIYDATHYVPFTVSSAGGLTIAPIAATTAITGAATVSTSVKTPFTVLTGVTSGTAGTDSLLTKDATTNQVKKISANYYATSSGYVPTIRTITTGYGLTGGGDLSANRTFVADTTSSTGLVSKSRLTANFGGYAQLSGAAFSGNISAPFAQFSSAGIATGGNGLTMIGGSGITASINLQDPDGTVITSKGVLINNSGSGNLALKNVATSTTVNIPTNVSGTVALQSAIPQYGSITLVAGVGTATVTGVSTSSKATTGFVSIGGTVTTTWQYKVACTANTVTITAITNAGSTNTSDTSTLNYAVKL